jgi:hypothetical protein
VGALASPQDQRRQTHVASPKSFLRRRSPLRGRTRPDQTARTQGLVTYSWDRYSVTDMLVRWRHPGVAFNDTWGRRSPCGESRRAVCGPVPKADYNEKPLRARSYVTMPAVLPPRIRRLWAVALLPLLVCMLSGWSATGGWFCETGAPCRPDSALTCCCGIHTGDDDCCAPGSRRAEAARAHPCGCFYQSHSVEARRTHPGSPLSGPIAAPLIASITAPPPLLTARFARSPEPLAPPGRFRSPRSTRGPPHA